MQPAAGLELVTRCSRRDLPRRWRGLPGSWRTPVSVPCSSTPAGSRTPGHCGVAMRPSVNCTTSAPASRISGLNRTARSLAVYASQPGSPRHHARLAPGRWPGSTGRGWIPAGSHRKVSACGFPLSQAFLAHAIVLLAEPAVVLPGHARRVRPLPGEGALVDDADGADGGVGRRRGQLVVEGGLDLGL